jgi:hypothetical protein
MGIHASGAQFEAFGSDGTIIARSPGTSSSSSGREEAQLLYGSATDGGLRALAPSDREPRTQPVQSTGRFTASAIRAFAMMLEDWLPAFAAKPTRVADLYDGWAVQQIIDAARQSSDGAGWVDIEPTDPKRA